MLQMQGSISHRPHTVRYFADPSFAAHSLSYLSY